MPPEEKEIVVVGPTPEARSSSVSRRRARFGGPSTATRAGPRAPWRSSRRGRGRALPRFGRWFNEKGKTSDDESKGAYKILSSKTLGERHIEFTYLLRDVNKPDEEPQTLTIVWDDSREVDAKLEEIIRMPKEATAAEGAEDEASDATADAQPASAQPVISGPEGEVTVEQINPEFTPRGSRRFDVGFDQNSRRYFRGRNAEKLVEQIKTSPRTLPGGQKGIEIVDPGEGPADKFRIKRGDVIVSINGQPTPTREAILRIARTFNENTSRVTIVIHRNTRKITYNVDPRDPDTRRKAAQAAERMGGG